MKQNSKELICLTGILVCGQIYGEKHLKWDKDIPPPPKKKLAFYMLMKLDLETNKWLIFETLVSSPHSSCKTNKKGKQGFSWNGSNEDIHVSIWYCALHHMMQKKLSLFGGEEQNLRS